ncbi:hypothetical protein [Streptomyces sp. NPDC048196]|uniref:hypothetical protein n=1 Tax=Streptomyces sp. NPDC048196 TaxID=3154712 RepID=UPI0033E366E2
MPAVQGASRENAVLPLVGGDGCEVAAVMDLDDLRQRGFGHGLALESSQADVPQPRSSSLSSNYDQISLSSS